MKIGKRKFDEWVKSVERGVTINPEMAFAAGAASRDAEVAKAFEAGRQAEREDCAKVCESTYPEYGGANPYCFETPSECAEAIRARGYSK